MAALDNSKIEEIRKSVNIIDVISEYLPLTQRGRNYFGVCPFHDDHSPSMSVSPDLQIYTCFSCGATGNVFKFIMDYENVSFMEAVRKVADKGGIDVNLSGIKSKRVVNSDLYEMYDIAKKTYQNNLNSEYGVKAKEYLKDRDISEEIIKEFGIGLSLIKNDVLTSIFIKKEYKNADIIKSGLIVQDGRGMHDIYSNRIMFPLDNLEGKTVGFSGRIYDTKDSSKYINTKETEIFKKGEILYNYHRAKDACRLSKTVIIMEGFMDVIRAYTIGVTNVVASMGTAITRNHANLLKKLAPNIILLFDGDAAGEKATLSCIDELANVGVTPKIVRLEEDLDPDDYIRKYGKERFMEKLNNPMNVMDFKMQHMRFNRNLNDPVELAKYINECLGELNRIDDDILRELTLKKLVNESGIDENLLRSKLVKKEVKKEKFVRVEPRYNKYEKEERNLLYYMLNSVSAIKKYMKKVVFLPDDNYRTLANKIRYFYEEHNNKFDVADFYTYISRNDNEELIKILDSVLNMTGTITDEKIDASLEAITGFNLERERNRIEKEIGTDIDLSAKKEKLNKLVELKRRGEKND